MPITPDQARRELARRELARRELSRRSSGSEEPTASSYSFPQALLRSGGEYLGNTAQAIFHPIQTVKGLGNIAAGGVQQLIPGEQAQEPYFDAVGEFITKRYGTVDRAIETLKHDPVGVMADASTALTGGAGIAAKIGSMGKVNRLAQAGRVAGQAGRLLDPLTATTKAVGLATRTASVPSHRTAGRLLNSIIKPRDRQFSYGHNPGLTVAKEGIVATSFDDLAAKIAQRRQQVGQQIGQALIIPPVAGKRLNLSSALDPINDAIAHDKKNPLTNSAIILRLENLRDDFLGVVVDPQTGAKTITKNLTSMTPSEAFQFKSTIAELTKWTDNLTDDRFVDAVLKKAYTKVRQPLEQVVPGIKPLNERYGGLIEAEKASRRQAIAVERGTRPGFLDVVSAGTGAGVGAMMYGANPTAMITGALLSAGTRRLLQSPMVRTGLAAFLTKSSPAEISALFNKIPGLQQEMMRWGLLAGTGQQRVQEQTLNR